MSSEPPLIASPNQPTGKKTPPGAVWSLVLGILSLFCLWLLGSIPAIILGALSIKKAKANPETVGGEGLALAGIQQRAVETVAMQRVREVAHASAIYATDQPDGEYPETLNDLIPEFLADESVLTVPYNDGTSAPIRYRRVDAGAGPDEPMLLLKLPGTNRYILGYNDGSVQRSTTPLERSVLEAFGE